MRRSSPSCLATLAALAATFSACDDGGGTTPDTTDDAADVRDVSETTDAADTPDVEPDAGDDDGGDVPVDAPDVEPDVADDGGTDVPVDGDGDLADAPDVADIPDATREVDLTAACVHVPAMVGAGGGFAIAIYGETTGCITYDRAEVSASGTEIDVRLVGVEDLVGPCPSCIWTFVGLVRLDAPSPGSYTVRVAGWPDETVVASGGIVEEPTCPAACPSIALDSGGWTLARVAGDGVHVGCGDYVNVGTGMTFAGSCHELTAAGADWDFPTRTLHCTDGELYFGAGALYQVDATLCDGTGTTLDRLILGTANWGSTLDPPFELFLIEPE